MSTVLAVRRNGFGFYDDSYFDPDAGPNQDGGSDNPNVPEIVYDEDNDPWYGSDTISTTTSAPRDSSGQPSVFSASLPGIIAAGLKTISNIFAPVGTSVAQAQAGAQQSYYGAQAQYYRNSAGQLVAGGAAGTQLVNAGTGVLDTIGRPFGVSGTTVLVVGAAALFLLYRPSPGRR